MHNKSDVLVSASLIMCAVTLTAAVVHRTFFPQRVYGAASPPPDFIAGWKAAIPIGVRAGPPDARVTILELADLECPACRELQPDMASVVAEHSRDVAVIFVQFPLPYHRFALPAARAAVCAHDAGAFDSWIRTVYENQDSLGLKSWGAYAHAAGIADTARIARCAADPRPIAQIQAGLAFGNEIHLEGTPTVLLNGWRFHGTPSKTELESAINRILDGKSPFKA